MRFLNPTPYVPEADKKGASQKENKNMSPHTRIAYSTIRSEYQEEFQREVSILEAIGIAAEYAKGLTMKEFLTKLETAGMYSVYQYGYNVAFDEDDIVCTHILKVINQ